MRILLFDVFNRCSLVQLKKIGTSKHLLLRKTNVLKISIFLERKFEEILRKYEEQKGQGLFGETFILGLSLFSHWLF